MKNLLNTVIEQQTACAENQMKAEPRTADLEKKLDRNAEAIAALLTIAELHEDETNNMNLRMDKRFSACSK